MKIVKLYESNHRDAVATMRAIATEIEAGKYGSVSAVGIVVFGDSIAVHGAGPESEAPTIACLLQAGALQIIQAPDKFY